VCDFLVFAVPGTGTGKAQLQIHTTIIQFSMAALTVVSASSAALIPESERKAEKLTSDGGVIKTILRHGSGDHPVEFKHRVLIAYTGFVKATGSEFDHWHGYPLKVDLGTSMSKRELALLFIYFFGCLFLYGCVPVVYLMSHQHLVPYDIVG
jgi:hypothetical protein